MSYRHSLAAGWIFYQGVSAPVWPDPTPLMPIDGGEGGGGLGGGKGGSVLIWYNRGQVRSWSGHIWFLLLLFRLLDKLYYSQLFLWNLTLIFIKYCLSELARITHFCVWKQINTTASGKVEPIFRPSGYPADIRGMVCYLLRCSEFFF